MVGRGDGAGDGCGALVIHGVAGDSLYGDAFTVVASSWHSPTDEDGWRLRNPLGGQHTFVTGHPRYLIHLDRHCPDCLIHMRALEELLLPGLPRKPRTPRSTAGGTA